MSELEQKCKNCKYHKIIELPGYTQGNCTYEIPVLPQSVQDNNRVMPYKRDVHDDFGFECKVFDVKN